VTIEYVRKTYGVPATLGGRVTYNGTPGVIVRATHYVVIRLDGRRPVVYVHPTDPGLIYGATEAVTASDSEVTK